ncbi:MAG: hypothetical protein RRC34_10205 [Lentisphaeria bacterium]|nr:hypothetical protein [Lentisphaeria bacterium]
MDRLIGALGVNVWMWLWLIFFFPSLGALAAEPEVEADLKALKNTAARDEADSAIRGGLTWLVAQQDTKNGNFGPKLPHAYTALSCLALLAAGEQPGRSEYGDALRKGILYLADKASRGRGYLGGDGSRMYGHGIATLALCEAYGMLDSPEANKRVGEAAAAALRVTIQAQVRQNGPHRGGWRYEPDSRDADLSVTAWQVLTLRAAKNCGFDIPDRVIQDALDYVRGLHSGAGFSYQQGRPPTPAMQAAGIVCLKIMGADTSAADKAKIATAAKSLEKSDNSRGRNYYYENYYLAMAGTMLGDALSSSVLPQLEKSLMRLQREDGQFDRHTGNDGGVYATAFAVVCLSAHYHYLPVTQE